MGSSLHEFVGPCQDPAPAWAPHRFTASSQASTCSSMALLPGLWVDLWISVVLQGLSSCVIMACTIGCRGISDPAPGAHPAVPPVLTLVCAGCHSHMFSPHSFLCAMPWVQNAIFLSLLLKFFITEVLLSFLFAALTSSKYIFGAAMHWCCQTWRKFLAATHRCHPCSPSATKVWPCKPNR